MRPFALARLNNSWSCACILLVQVRRKGENENLAEWVVHITSEADCKGSNVFVTTYQKCGSSMPGNLPLACTVPAWARKTASIICGFLEWHHVMEVLHRRRPCALCRRLRWPGG